MMPGTNGEIRPFARCPQPFIIDQLSLQKEVVPAGKQMGCRLNLAHAPAVVNVVIERVVLPRIGQPVAEEGDGLPPHHLVRLAQRQMPLTRLNQPVLVAHIKRTAQPGPGGQLFVVQAEDEQPAQPVLQRQPFFGHRGQAGFGNDGQNGA